QEAVDVPVEHRTGIAGFDPGAQVFDHLIGLQDVRPDLVTPADIGLGRVHRLDLGLARLQFALIKPGAQHRECVRPVLVLGPFTLALNDDAARHVGDADRAVGLVDVLPASAGGAIGVDAQVLVVDLDLDLLVDDRVDPDGGKAGVPPRVRIERRYADQAVDAALGFEPAIGVDAADLDRRR